MQRRTLIATLLVGGVAAAAATFATAQTAAPEPVAPAPDTQARGHDQCCSANGDRGGAHHGGERQRGGHH